MKTPDTPLARAILALVAPVLLTPSALAQDAAPPTVRATVPQPPASTSADAPAAVSRTVLSPEAQAALDEAREARPDRQPRATPPRPVARRETASSTNAPAPAAAPTLASPPVPIPPPASEAVAPNPPPPAPAADDAATTTDATAATEERTGETPLWPLALILGLIVLAGVGYHLWNRRRTNAAFSGQYEPEVDYYAPADPAPAHADPVSTPVAPAYAEPTAALARVDATGSPGAAYAVAEDASLTHASADDLTALTAAAPPIHDRPWLEFALRPVRAGATADEVVVEIELTVANSGTTAAEDVRVSTFMLAEGDAADVARRIAGPPADGAVDAVTIQPGEGTRIDATLAASRADIRAAGITPVVVADARYPLMDGGEGRTSAAFLVGVAADGALIPFDLADNVVRDDIEARLHGEPRHA